MQGPVWWRGAAAFAFGRSWLIPWRIVVLTGAGDWRRVRRRELRGR